jgi:hypothetical protein
MIKPTIYEALAQKLGREPTNAELKADVRRILDEAALSRRGTAMRVADARAAHRGNDPRAGIRAYCAGNRWLTENAKAVGNW